MDEIYTSGLPGVHGVLRRLRKVADQYDAVLVGETWTSNIQELKKYYGAHNDEIQLPMNFMFAMLDRVSAPEFRKQISYWIESSGGWPTFVISNHDIQSAPTNRYGDGQHNDAIAKLMAGNVSDSAGHAHHVLRRRVGHGEQTIPSGWKM